MPCFEIKITITYPGDVDDPETDKIYNLAHSHLMMAARMNGLDADWNWTQNQPEGYCELTNTHYRKDIVTLSRQVKHIKTVVALSKFLEGYVGILNIWTDADISYYYPGDL